MECNIGCLHEEARWMRRRIVELAHRAGKKGAHLGGSLSIVEILIAVYATMSKKRGQDRDRLILSKGHAALALYSLLEHWGVLTVAETDTFEENGTHLYAHAPRDIDKGLEFAGGSLSLGLSFAVGVALACRKRRCDNRIFAIVGDGECNEGLVWESAMSIANYNLTNMTIIVDCNSVQLDGPTKDVMDIGSLCRKFEAFGFEAIECDGHDIGALLSALGKETEKPKAIIAHTVKGKGLTFCEGQYIWHHNVLTDKLYEEAMEELR